MIHVAAHALRNIKCPRKEPNKDTFSGVSKHSKRRAGSPTDRLISQSISQSINHWQEPLLSLRMSRSYGVVYIIAVQHADDGYSGRGKFYGFRLFAIWF